MAVPVAVRPGIKGHTGAHGTDASRTNLRTARVLRKSAPLAAYDITAGDWREYVSHDLPNGPKAFVISVTALQGLTTCGDAFAPLRALEPSGRIGYSLIAHSLDRRDVVETLDRIARDTRSPRE